MITVVDARQWLREGGRLPDDPRLRARVLRVAQCIEAGCRLARGFARETLVACKRRPRGEACPGLLWVVKRSDDCLHVLCPTCQTDEFVIEGWEETDWADGPSEPIFACELFESFEQDPATLRAFDRLEQVLVAMRSSLSASAVVHLLVEAGAPLDVVGVVMESLTEPPPEPLIEQLVAVLLELRPATG